MSGQIGEAFVVVKPIVHDFRGEVQAVVRQNIGNVAVPIPVTPTLGPGAAASLTWERIAGGAVVPVAMPVAPVIPPAQVSRFRNEVGGLRGLLLGGAQFGAARALGISSAAAGLFVFSKAALGAVKSAATLEQELDVFRQVSGATADEMARVAAEARSLGADIRLPGVSSGDAAATMVELAKAGLSVDDVLKGTRGTLQLATAANIDFGVSAELASNALNGFQLPGAAAVRVADLLAGAANAAQGDIGDFGAALAQSAAVAHQAGISIDDTVTFLTELAKAGIQGSDAGTSLRVALLRLIAPGAQAKKIFEELGVEISDAQGNIRTDVFEQLRVSMDRLEPATRNAALATIFGTDAVRAAAIFVRDGAAGFQELADQVTRAGQAQETAAARTEGLAGKAGALSSNLETLGTDLGTIAIPLLSDLADAANVAVGDIDALVVEVDKLSKKASGLSLGPFGKLGHLVEQTVKDAVKAPFAPLHSAIDLMRGDFKGAAVDLEALVPGLDSFVEALTGAKAAAEAPIQVSAAAVARNTIGAEGPALAAEAATVGKKVGSALGKGVADGIIQEDQRSVAAARRTLADVLEEGDKAVTRARAALADTLASSDAAIAAAITQGQQAVAAAAVDAKQNLRQIGQDLAAQVAQIIDTGPLASRIKFLQDQLDAGRARLQRGNLRQDLKDARAELERAQAQVETAPGQRLSAAQQAGIDQFLTPFQQKVKDAQAALEEFNTQGSIDKLTARLAQQQKSAAQTLDGLVAKFNAGLISGPQLSQRLSGFLSRNVGPITDAGQKQGVAFRLGFQAELAGLRAQIAEIIGGPQTAKTGAEPRVVSPGGVAAQATKDIAAARDAATKAQIQAEQNLADTKEQADKSRFNAQQSLQEDQRRLHKDEVKEAQKANNLLGQIRDQLAGTKTPSTKPSGATAKTPAGGRTGGR